MAKDDFHVIVYQLLAYLYTCLKRGEEPDPKRLCADSDFFKANGQALNAKYWAYIVYNMHRLGLIDGVVFAEMDGLNHPYPVNLDGCIITPLGIEYLTDNAFIAKAKEFLKDIKAIVPFV